MKRKVLKRMYHIFRYLLFMIPFLAFTYCQKDAQTTDSQDQGIILTEQATLLMKSSVSKSDDSDENCIEYQYPIEFYYYFPGSHTIEAAIIYNDEQLFDFFDMVKDADEIRIDFPIVLYGDESEQVIINDLEQLISTLQVAIDACRGDEEEYDYCDDNHKKVNICHNGKTICVSVSAIQAHIGHGDVLGACEEKD